MALKIDCHGHILPSGTGPEYKAFVREMQEGLLRKQGRLPARIPATDEDWAKVEANLGALTPELFLKDHDEAGIDRSVILSSSPSTYTSYGYRGTVDPYGVTGVPGPVSPDKCNDYIAALARKYPTKLIGIGSVNPLHRGVKEAVAELDRCIKELRLPALKLYPTYQHWSPDDRALAFPIFARAAELDIPVVIHQASTPTIDAPLKFARPYLLDDVGREFRKLRLIVAHAGTPWIDECIDLCARHPNFYMDISYFISLISREEIYRFFLKCKERTVPLGKVLFGTDYPLDNVKALVEKVLSVNKEAKRLGLEEISAQELDGIMGENLARLFRLGLT